uniref:Uncharacterized protein n=1 Tax=Setaria viridis TaxID=4556 RepID=A0A4U6TEW0_SETVI|nr:hypothetical protein SEVIR_8G051101v2 [Setaria viridis]
MEFHQVCLSLLKGDMLRLKAGTPTWIALYRALHLFETVKFNYPFHYSLLCPSGTCPSSAASANPCVTAPPISYHPSTATRIAVRCCSAVDLTWLPVYSSLICVLISFPSGSEAESVCWTHSRIRIRISTKKSPKTQWLLVIPAIPGKNLVQMKFA